MIALPRKDYDVVGSVVTFKTDPAEVERAVAQFLAVPLKTHLCIIDNSPAALRLPRFDPDRVSYFFTNRNLGYGSGHNLALRAAFGRTRHHLVMNTDISYGPEVVRRLTDFLDATPEAGLAGPKVRYPNGSLQYVCRLLPTPANMFLRRFLPGSALARRADERYELRAWSHNTFANIPYFQGSFIMLRSTVCQQVGGFDERYFLYGEDIDLTRRIHRVAQTVYVPDVEITHEYRRLSNSSWLGTWYGIQNNCRYFNKWGWFFDQDRKRINHRVVQELGLSP